MVVKNYPGWPLKWRESSLLPR